MLTGPFVRFFVKLVEVGIQLAAIDPPDSSATDLDCRKTSRSNERIDLGNADTQVCGHVLQSQIARLDLGLTGLCAALCSFRRTLRGRHAGTIAPGAVRYLDLMPFAPVWLMS